MIVTSYRSIVGEIVTENMFQPFPYVNHYFRIFIRSVIKHKSEINYIYLKTFIY